MTVDPINGPFVRGKLALAGIDLSAELGTWLDAVYAVWAELPPDDRLKQMASQVLRKSAMMRPEEFRETWGRTAQARALAGGLGKGPGVESGSVAGAAPDQAAVRQHWDRLQQRRKGG